MSERFDLVVIGSGPAGEKAAAQAAYHGRSVAIVERDERVGGSAVGNAGIPTKTLRETALYLTGFRRREIYGVAPQLDAQGMFDHLRVRTFEVIERMTDAVRANIDRHGIELIQGVASFRSPHELDVKVPDGSRRQLEAGVFLIATGSRPLRPEGIDFDDPDVLDSTEIFGVNGPVGNIVVLETRDTCPIICLIIPS